MRTHHSGVAAGARAVSGRARWHSLWLELSSLVIIAFVLMNCFRHTWDMPVLVPLLAVPPALAGIGAASVRRPLAYGAISIVAVVAVAFDVGASVRWLAVATMITVVVITAVAAAGTEISVRQERRIAEVTSVAEAAQRALLRPLPGRVGPLGFGVVYLAAAAEAKVGGDLYEVVHTAGMASGSSSATCGARALARSSSRPTSSACSVSWRTTPDRSPSWRRAWTPVSPGTRAGARSS